MLCKKQQSSYCRPTVVRLVSLIKTSQPPCFFHKSHPAYMIYDKYLNKGQIYNSFGISVHPCRNIILIYMNTRTSPETDASSYPISSSPAGASLPPHCQSHQQRPAHVCLSSCTGTTTNLKDPLEKISTHEFGRRKKC